MPVCPAQQQFDDHGTAIFAGNFWPLIVEMVLN